MTKLFRSSFVDIQIALVHWRIEMNTLEQTLQGVGVGLITLSVFLEFNLSVHALQLVELIKSVM